LLHKVTNDFAGTEMSVKHKQPVFERHSLESRAKQRKADISVAETKITMLDK